MKVIIAWDGDHIGREVGRASLADDVEGLRRISQAIDRGNEIWKSWVVNNGGSMISYGGDEGRAEIPAEHLSELPKIRDQYASAVSATVSVGVGTRLSEADRALIAAKLRGGNHIVLYTEDIDAEVEAATKKDRPEADKLAEEYLTKASPAPEAPAPAQPALNQGPGGAGMQGASKPQGPSIQAPALEGSEHSQGEAAQAMVDSQGPAPEMTHAAQDLEEQFHDLAQAGKQQDQHPEVPGENKDAIKLQIVQVLQALKAQAPILEQIKQTAPDTYKAVMAMAQAVISMAKEMAGEGQHVSLAQLDASARSNATVMVDQPPEEGEDDKGEDTKKSECEHFYGASSKCLRCKAEKIDKGELKPGKIKQQPTIRQTLDKLHGTVNHRYDHQTKMFDEKGVPEDERDGADDSAMDWSCPECNALPIAQSETGRCTSTAAHIAQQHGGKVMGYGAEENPGAIGDEGGGHDFALVNNGRHLADWWANSYHGHPDLYDLHDPKQAAQVKKLYGDPAKWKQMYDYSKPGEKNPWSDWFKAGEHLTKEELPADDKKKPDDWVDCDERGHTWGSGPTDGACLMCGCDQKVTEAELDKASLVANGKPPPARHHVVLPVGSKIDPGSMGTRDTGKIKVLHPESGKEGWIQARAGQVLSQDGHAISSRNPNGK